MPKVAVLTVSKRSGWEGGAYDAIYSQTLRPDFWAIVQEGQRREGVLENFIPISYMSAPKKTRASNLNRSLNFGLKRCMDCDYVIFYQDFIELPKDCFAKLVEAAEQTGRFITTATINHDGTMDGRYTGSDGLRPCSPQEWESNVAIAPMKAIKELGGFDEEYDNGWSWDNCNLAERAEMLGYRFLIDESNKPQLLFHPKEPDVNPHIKPNGDLHARVMQEIRDGKRPLRLPYLD